MINALKNAEQQYVCPRCSGAGEWVLEGDDFQCVGSCPPCGNTGKVTPKRWQKWCAVAYDAESLMQWDRWITWDDWVAKGKPSLP
jgi:hypothetical protein